MNWPHGTTSNFYFGRVVIMETRTQLNPLVACFLIVLLGALVMAAQASPIITEFPIPSVPGSPLGIAEGPDGNMWFTEQLPNKIGRITPDGRITEYPIPTPNSSPYSPNTRRARLGELSPRATALVSLPCRPTAIQSGLPSRMTTSGSPSMVATKSAV